MDKAATNQAIKYALNGNWENAIVENLSILKQYPYDTDCLNRLARAYVETGQIRKAKTIANKVVKIDPNNIIAIKCLDKIKRLKEGELNYPNTSLSDSFLEDPGKTKLITLINPSSENILDKLDSGDEVFLACHSHKVSIATFDGKYIGKLPDDISLKLRNLVKQGFKYKVLIKSIQNRDVKIFIREIQRPKNLNGLISFLSDKIDYIPYTPPELIQRKEEIELEEEL